MSRYKIPLKYCTKCGSTKIRIEYPIYEETICNDRMDVICNNCEKVIFRINEPMEIKEK